MKEEILAAVVFLVSFIEKSGIFPQYQLENFKNNLVKLLMQRFEKHWFPDLPSKGQGYRCIRLNELSPVDITIQEAARQCGIKYKDLRLPKELTVWVDPNEVCYRLGESEGSHCVLATFPSKSPKKNNVYGEMMYNNNKRNAAKNHQLSSYFFWPNNRQPNYHHPVNFYNYGHLQHYNNMLAV